MIAARLPGEGTFLRPFIGGGVVMGIIWGRTTADRGEGDLFSRALMLGIVFAEARSATGP